MLSTYNGNEYVRQQINSIYRQTYSDFTLYVRDDGSKPEFVTVLKDLQKEFHFQLILGENLGFVGSFMSLLEQVTDADLYSFADQDDIWLPHKLQTAVEWYEKNQNEDIPILYHSAYDIVDSGENKIGSFYYPNDGYDFRRSITENHYSGFAMVINRKMRTYMLMGDWHNIGYHDWWAAMIAHFLGIGYSDPFVCARHRAHGDNVTTFNMKTRLQWLIQVLREDSDIKKRAEEFFRCFAEKLSNEKKQMLERFSRRGYHPADAFWKAFYPKRWRPVLSSELVVRMLMLIGKI